MNHHTLFTNVHDYFTDLVTNLASARHQISMSFLAFEEGRWARNIAGILRAKLAEGIQVRLLVDELGQLFDKRTDIFRNFEILADLRSLGVQVDIFRPAHPMNILNRLHTKFAAIDDTTVFLGGSNIGDYYTSWTDTNLRVEGNLGNIFHQVYDLLTGFSKHQLGRNSKVDLTNLQVGNERLFLTIPGSHFGIRNALLELIHRAESALFNPRLVFPAGG